MESMMSDLMAAAAGKMTAVPPFQLTQHHAKSFICHEEFRQEDTTLSTDDEVSSSSFSSASSSDHSDAYDSTTGGHYFSTGYSSPSSWNYPSYVPCYSVSGYSSPPTYIRGDFYNITPPSSPSLMPLTGSTTPINTRYCENFTNTDAITTSLSSLSFSVASIMGSRDTPSNHPDTPAEVYSAVSSSMTHVSSGQFRFSPADWSIFQPPVRPTPSSASPPVHAYWCHVCGDFCSDKADAMVHQNSHLNNGDMCKLRRQLFNNHGYITEHVQTGILNRIKCGLCDKIVTQCFFSRHLRCHDGHLCHVCGYEYTSNSRLLDHMNKHAGVKPHVCKICNQQFSDRRRLSNHTRQHKESTIQCSFCNKIFPTKYACAIHERIHTGNHPFACEAPGCKKAFPQKIQLRLHLNTHKKRGDL